MIKVLLVDDDEELTKLLSDYLLLQNMQSSIANNGKEALEILVDNQFDIMVLDVMMPEIDGMTVLKKLNDEAMPIIMLSAKCDDIDRIVGLELGADDYVNKPCNPRELVSRINAVLRRTNQSTNNISRNYNDGVISHKTINIDNKSRVCSIAGKELVLTATEFDLLYLMLTKKGELVDKETLSQIILGRELNPFDRSIDVHISRLRKKLEKQNLDIIKTLRGKGYQLI